MISKSPPSPDHLATGGSFVRMKQPRHEAVYSPHYTADVKNKWRGTSSSLMLLCHAEYQLYLVRVNCTEQNISRAPVCAQLFKKFFSSLVI